MGLRVSFLLLAVLPNIPFMAMMAVEKILW
jgi:hypothetical protein